MAIRDHDRKILWGQSGNRCAICRRLLVTAKTAGDPEAIVGDEAHIVARSPGGPRAGHLPGSELNAYDNLILLCRVDHKVIDDQPQEYTRERLRQIKAEHEAWVVETLGEHGDGEPIEVVDDPSAPPLHLTLLRSGDDIWPIINDVQRYYLAGLSESEADPKSCDLADQFLQEAHDWGEVSSEVNHQGLSHVRQAKRSLSDHLAELRRAGLVVFGGRQRRIVRGGVQRPSFWYDAVLEVVKADDPRIIVGTPPGASSRIYCNPELIG